MGPQAAVGRLATIKWMATNESTNRAIRTAIAMATTQARVAAAALQMARAAVSPSGPFAAPLADAIGAVEESVSILTQGHLGPDDLDRLASAARRVEAALGSMQVLGCIPGPIGRAGRLLALLRPPLRAWARYIARDPSRPDAPSPLELAVGNSAA